MAKKRMGEGQWLSCADPHAMLNFLNGKASDRKLRLFACACCRSIWPLLKDKRSRKAVEVAELFVDRLTTREEIVESLCHLLTSLPVVNPLQAANRFVDRLIGEADLESARCDAEAVAEGASGSVAWAAREVVNECAHGLAVETAYLLTDENKVVSPETLCDLLRDIFGAAFRSIKIKQAWLGWNSGVVPKLAESIYDDRAFDRLPILADALEEAGCTDANILYHLRGPGPHARGCWLVDLLTGRE